MGADRSGTCVGPSRSQLFTKYKFEVFKIKLTITFSDHIEWKESLKDRKPVIMT